jgi:hypothetical protein
MQRTTLTLLALLLTTASAPAQYTPPSPAGPVPGAIDDYLKANDPSLSGWGFGVNDRLRSENKSDAGTTHAGSNYDFSAAPPTDNSNDYWLNRLFLTASFTNDWLTFFAEGRSSYSFGDDRFTATAAGKNLPEDDGPIQLHQGYVLLGNLKSFPVTAKVGRQELTYGDQRLVGNALWLNVPHTFDAVKLRYQDSFLGVDLFAANLVYVNGDNFGDHFETSNSQDTLSGAYVDLPGLSRGNVNEAYVFARNVARGIVTDNWAEVPAPFRFTSPEDLYTFGYHAKSRPGTYGPWDYGLEAMGQVGDRTAVFPATTVAAALAAPRLDQDAWAFVAQGSYSFRDLPLDQKLALIVSAASGDRNSKDKDSQTFQNLLPSNHGLYGMMDLSSLQNIVDYRASYTMKPDKSVSLSLDAHQQYLENTNDYWYNVAGVPRNTPGATPGSGKGFGINPGYSPDLGQEIDAIAGWTPARGLLLEAGAGHFFRGAYVKESFSKVGSRDSDYLYVQATLNL